MSSTYVESGDFAGRVSDDRELQVDLSKLVDILIDTNTNETISSFSP